MEVEPTSASQSTMRKPRKAKMNAVLEEFLTNSSMHGLKYIAQNDCSWVERFDLLLDTNLSWLNRLNLVV